MKVEKLLLVFALLQFGCTTAKSDLKQALIEDAGHKTDSTVATIKSKGWSHLFTLLLKSSVPPESAARALASPEMPPKDILTFKLKPKEPYSAYSSHNTPKRRQNAYEFYLRYRETFLKAKELFEVPTEVILAILQVETHCGKHTGSKSIFPAIARLANAGDPEIIRANVKANHPKLEDAVYRRAAYLETTFLPHLVATFKLAEGEDVHSLKGSFAGAMGIPQFMPDNIIRFGVDGDSDGMVDLHNPHDAILSTANYLKQHGWDSHKLSRAKQRAVIWSYNRSVPYIDTVLTMATSLQSMINLEGGPARIDERRDERINTKSTRKSPYPSESVRRGDSGTSPILRKNRSQRNPVS